MALAQQSHSASVEGTPKIVTSIKSEKEFSVLEHRSVVMEAQAKLRKHQMEQNQRKLKATLEQMDTRSRYVVMRAVNGKTSGWLNVLPIALHKFDLSTVEFQDALAMRFCRLFLRYAIYS